MDTNRLKRFAVEARNILMQGVKNRLQAMGFDLKTGKPAELPQKMEGGAVFMGDTVSTDFYCRWMSLYNNICARGIRQVAEEAAYTWFNRFMAIRIMQKQGFISPVLAYESEDVRVPVIVSEARQGRMPQMSDDVRGKLMELLDDDSKTNEQFALLIVAYCHENPIINKCFGNIADYTELLLPQNILAEGGFVSMLNDTAFIKDDDFRSAELIGWLYQFYISDRKAEAFAKKGKYDTDEIAPATQIFTPNWIVKYMVENTVGRIYIDNNPYCEVKDNMKYLVDTPSGGETLKVDDLAQLTVADLACGSGHILNECFDLLYAIYVEEGYSRTQGISHILRRNLLGIDLDTRAKQLATFALLMKACQKDSAFLDGKVMPRVYDMPHPIAEAIAAEGDTRSAEEYLKETLPHYLLGGNTEMVRELTDAILLMNHANTFGSIMKFDISEQTRNAILVRTQEYEEQLANGDIVPSAIQLLMPYMRIILALTEKYTALVMNPPYMGSGHFDSVLSKYVKDNYAEGKADLFSVFMQMGMERLADGGKMAQINMQSWMFLSSFEKLRNIFLHNYIIDSMLHLGPRTFDELSGEVVQNTAFVLTKPHDPYGGITLGEVKTLPEVEKAEWKRRFMEDTDKDLSDWLVDGAKGTYYRLVDGKNCADKEQLFLSHIHGNEDGNRVYYPNVEQKNFDKIPGCPIGYWLGNVAIDCFEKNKLGDMSYSSPGIRTGRDNIFIRDWEEVSYKRIKLDGTSYVSLYENYWFPITRGGERRVWYGNNSSIVLGYNNFERVQKECPDYRLRDKDYYFKKGLTWTMISSSKSSFRVCPNGVLFGNGGPTLYVDNLYEEISAFLNSSVADFYLKLLNPTINCTKSDIEKLPIVFSENNKVKSLVCQNISLSKQDWDAHETSWDFQRNELLRIGDELVGDVSHVTTAEMPTVENDLLAMCGETPHPLNFSLKDLVSQYKQKWEHKFKQLHENEEELNRQFIDIYGLQDELTPDVPLDEITILQQGEITIE